MKLEASTERDIEQLSRWIDQDEYHNSCIDPVWWLTGVDGSLLCFCLQDNEGPLCYVRLDEKVNELIRLHTQFAPKDEVSKLRLVKGMLKCVPIVQQFCKQQEASGIIFQSTSSSLIDFMNKKFGFEPAGGDDYVWPIGTDEKFIGQ